MGYPLVRIFLEEVNKFINSLVEEERRKFALATTLLCEGNFEALYIKQITKNIKELRIKKYRLLFFFYQNSVYFVHVFVKKTNKTPKKEIDRAEKYYKLITNN